MAEKRPLISKDLAVTGYSMDKQDVINRNITSANRADIGGNITAAQMQKMPDSAFLKMAGDEIAATAAARGFAPPTAADLSSTGSLYAYLGRLTPAHAAATQASLQGLFSKATASATANRDVAKHWNPEIASILGV
jgi:hypothetical protein